MLIFEVEGNVYVLIFLTQDLQVSFFFLKETTLVLKDFLLDRESINFIERVTFPFESTISLVFSP